MSELYTEAAAETLALLEEFGAVITVERTTGASVDPVTFEQKQAGASENYQPNAILRPYPSSVIDGTRIQVGDRELIMDARTEPRMTDKPIVQGSEWTIQNIIGVNPAGTPILYLLQVRG